MKNVTLAICCALLQAACKKSLQPTDLPPGNPAIKLRYINSGQL